MAVCWLSVAVVVFFSMSYQSNWYWQPHGDRKGGGKSDGHGKGYGRSQWHSSPWYGQQRQWHTSHPGSGTPQSYWQNSSPTFQWSLTPMLPNSQQPPQGGIAATAAATIEGANVSSVCALAWVSNVFSNVVSGVKRAISSGETAMSGTAPQASALKPVFQPSLDSAPKEAQLTSSDTSSVAQLLLAELKKRRARATC